MDWLHPATLALLIPIFAIAGGCTVAGIRIWARHRERMAMIEQGMNPDPLDPDQLDPDR